MKDVSAEFIWSLIINCPNCYYRFNLNFDHRYAKCLEDQLNDYGPNAFINNTFRCECCGEELCIDTLFNNGKEQ